MTIDNYYVEITIEDYKNDYDRQLEFSIDLF